MLPLVCFVRGLGVGLVIGTGVFPNLRWSHGEALRLCRWTFPVRDLQGPRGAGIRGAVWLVASASCCFRLGCVVERQVEQLGALAALMYEIGLGLMVVFPDGCHDGDGGSADSTVAGQALAGLPPRVVRNPHGSHGEALGQPDGKYPPGGAGASPGRCGAGIRGAGVPQGDRPPRCLRRPASSWFPSESGDAVLAEFAPNSAKSDW